MSKTACFMSTVGGKLSSVEPVLTRHRWPGFNEEAVNVAATKYRKVVCGERAFQKS